jgi:hypothetical protein
MEFVVVWEIFSWRQRVVALITDIAWDLKWEVIRAGFIDTVLQVLTHPWKCMAELARRIRNAELSYWGPYPYDVSFWETGSSRYAYLKLWD